MTINEKPLEIFSEQEPSIMQSIMYEIEVFKYNHNGFPPEKIFVSYPLHDKIIASFRMYPNRKESITMCGIPVQPYNCQEYEFYLAEKKGSFRRMIDDVGILTMQSY